MPFSVDPSAMEIATSALLVAVALVASYTDLRSRRIYNKLTYGAATAGLALNTVAYGLDGSLSSVKGWLLGAGVLLAFFLLKAMGAGDVKLLAAVGAIKGPAFVLNAFVFTGLAGGLIAIFVLLRQRRMRQALGGMVFELGNLVMFKQLPQRESVGATSLGVPYGPAIALGSLAALAATLL